MSMGFLLQHALWIQQFDNQFRKPWSVREISNNLSRRLCVFQWVNFDGYVRPLIAKELQQTHGYRKKNKRAYLTNKKDPVLFYCRTESDNVAAITQWGT
jgi:hypothetical protein